MSDNLEKSFLLELRKRKKEHRVTVLKVALLLFIVSTIVGLMYLLAQNNKFIEFGNLAISAIIPLLIIMGLILILILITYIRKNQRFKNKLLMLRGIKNIDNKHLFGITLLLILLVYQYNTFIINNQINGFFARLIYQPKPPALNSPWPWKEHNIIHPVVANMPSSVEVNIKSVAQYIAQNEKDEYLLIKALHDYVIKRISYDLDVLKTGIRPPQDAQSVFQARKAVCEGYANLFVALGRAIGINIVYIEGDIRKDLAPIDVIPKTTRLLHSEYDWTRHAWNAVKVSGNWQLVDTTWDDKDYYNADYLMLPPKAMILSHFPDLVDWQLLRSAKDQETFENNPILTPQFFTEDLKLISPTQNHTTVQKTALIEIKSVQNNQNQFVALFTKAKDDESIFSTFSDLLQANQSSQEKQDRKKCESEKNAEGVTKITCQLQQPGDYRVFIFMMHSFENKYIPIGQLKFRVL